MSIQLEHGRYYARRDGRIVGPVIKICDTVWDFWIPSDGFRPYLRSGKTGSPSGWIDSEADLVSPARDAQ